MFPNIKKHWVNYLFYSYLLISGHATAEIKSIDDSGLTIKLPHAAERIISLSPGMTELLFSAGAGEQIKGVVSYSDYPPAAKQIRRVGSYNSLDMELIVALQPDLIFAWQSGNPESQLQQLKKLGFRVFTSEPHELNDIAKIIRKMGKLSGHAEHAEKQANAFLKQLDQLRQNYQNKAKLSVFAQIWNKPVMSIGGNHLISRLIELCGGENIFQNHQSLTITPDIESVIEKQPQIILSTGMAKHGHAWLKRWQNWQAIPAVKHVQLYSINPDLLVRHTLRILEGTEIMCRFFDQARDKYQQLP